MINNGTIEVRTASGGGFDDDGNPIPVSETFTSIPCRINTVSKSDTGRYEDGKFTQASYLIFIDGNKEIAAERVRLHRHGVFLGEYKVQSNEYLHLVGRNKIIV